MINLETIFLWLFEILTTANGNNDHSEFLRKVRVQLCATDRLAMQQTEQRPTPGCFHFENVSGDSLLFALESDLRALVYCQEG